MRMNRVVPPQKPNVSGNFAADQHHHCISCSCHVPSSATQLHSTGFLSLELGESDLRAEAKHTTRTPFCTVLLRFTVMLFGSAWQCQDMAWLTCHPMGHQIPTWVRLVLRFDVPRFPSGRRPVPVPGGGIPGHMPLGHPVHPCLGLHLR